MTTEQTTRRVPYRNFVTIPEVAKARGISRVAVLYAIQSGRLRAYRVAGKRDWLITRRDAADYVSIPVRGRASE